MFNGSFVLFVVGFSVGEFCKFLDLSFYLFLGLLWLSIGCVVGLSIGFIDVHNLGWILLALWSG